MFKRISGAVSILALLLSPFSAYAVADPTPNQHYTAAYGGGNVQTVVAASDGSYYAAGDFNSYATSYGNAILASASSGHSESPFPDVDGEVYVTISDGSGGWYIGGHFNRVGTLQRTGVAHILFNGTPDSAFDADIVFADSTNFIYALATDGTRLYVGGDLDSAPTEEVTFSGVEAHGMFVLDAATGAPATGYTQPHIEKLPIVNTSTVYSLAVDSNGHVYAGGDFNRIGNGTTRNNLVSFDAGTGATTSFDPNLNNIVYALTVTDDNSTLYAGGTFTQVGGAGTDPDYLVALDTGTSATTSFDAGVSASIYALALDEPHTTLYAGGAFTTINTGSYTRNHLAAVDTVTGAADVPFDPDLNDDVFSIALTAAGDTLYAVGPFSAVNVASVSVTRSGIAAFDTVNDPGNDIAGFNQDPSGTPYFISLNDDDTSVLIGTTGGAHNRADEGSSYGGSGILHILPDGTVDPDFLAFVNGPIYALALSSDNNTLYAGGNFSTVNGGVPRQNLAAFDTTVALNNETDFDPSANNTVRALTLSSDGGTLYAGGDFSAVNLTHLAPTRNHIAAFDTAALDPTDNVMPFDPDVDSNVYSLVLSHDDDTLYAAGAFIFVNGSTSRQYLASFDTTSDPVNNVTVFYPDPDNISVTLALSSDGGTLYAGGIFTTVNGNIGTIARNYSAAFDSSSGVATDFDPDANNDVNALSFGPDGVLYMGGFFDEVNGDVHKYIAAVDADTGVPDSGFNTHLNNSVTTLVHGGTGNGLLAGGMFGVSFQEPGGSEVPYVVALGLVHYDDSSTPTPTPVVPTPTPTPGSSHSSSGGGSIGIGFPMTGPQPGATFARGDPINLESFSLHEGDVFRASDANDPDIYIVNVHGYKRLFLNPVIFSFYGHLGFARVKSIIPVGRDIFPTSGLFRNCEMQDQAVYAVEVTGEDSGILHHVQVSGDAAVSQDPEFFNKVFCINTNEFNWYPKSPVPYTSLSQIPLYNRP